MNKSASKYFQPDYREKGNEFMHMREDLQNIPVLAVDVANQVTRLGLFREDCLQATWSLTTPAHITADEARQSIATFLDTIRDGLLLDDGREARKLALRPILSCVVPDLTQTWNQALRSISRHRPLVVGPGIKTGIQMNYNDPSELGSDRIADIVAAKGLYGYPLIIVDCGITINYQVLDNEGVYVGGLIVPGLSLSARALAQAAARLPLVELSVPVGVLGKNTQESLQSGIIRGEAARANGLIEMIWQELGYGTTIVLAGEDASLIVPFINHEVHIDNDLTLTGLNELARMNRR